MALSFLLPTQAALLQRLQHLACFGLQATVIFGQSGSGKSTLLTSLASEQEGCNAALLVCPMHADAAELRRKILIQLLSDPLFDDEVPLMETIGRLCVTQTKPKPIHIFIDDAQHLPTELWVECLLLPRLNCGGRPICVTMTADASAGHELYRQLGQSQQELMLPIEIAPLPQAEREALYYSLMSRSDDVPYVPRDIVKARLEAQSGRPAEVIALLDKALEPQAPAPASGISRRGLAVAAGITVLFTLSLVAVLWSLWQAHPGNEVNMGVRQPSAQPMVSEGGLLRPFAASRLGPYFESRQAALAGLLAQDMTPAALQDFANEATEKLPQGAPQVQALLGSDLPAAPSEALILLPKANNHAMTVTEPAAEAKALDEARVLAQVPTADLLAPGAEQAPSHKSKGSRSVAQVAAPAAEAHAGPKAAKSWDEQDLLQGRRGGAGYTLQLTTVSKRESADGLMKQLAGEKGLRLASHKGKWVVLLGDYPTRADALAEAERISARYGTGKPWVRAWKDLTALQMLATASGGEISN